MQSGTKKDPAEKKPRGRPRAYQPEAALLQAAQVFWKTGYAGTSLDDIASATGMNRPSLRAAFGDKREIYIKVLSDYWARKFTAMHKALDSDGSLAEALMRVYDAALSIYFAGDDQALGCFVLGTAITEAPGDAEIKSMLTEGFHTLDANFEARFKRARASGELKHDADPKALALLAAATMQSLAIRARTGTSQKELRKLAQKAVSVICG
ncbi:TetR/AcrR family transcriptional regulator [Dyella silvatica]|uniref:TetR/AcrR family transcriptional regulator n=1 Tax=Dyella silvatica TaxID=2992128 RepID=UPI002258981D|nr:TetR/AcrR family transcriptional regulator [Dyella silvatica]